MTINIKQSFAILLFIFSILNSNHLYSQGNYYWIGGPGSWDDPSHWSKNSGGSPVGDIPSEGINAIFDNASGLTNGTVVDIPPGTFPVYDLRVLTSAEFELKFNSSSSNAVHMEVYGDLLFTSGMSITYVDNSIFRNSWKFLGGNLHTLETAGQDLLYAVFLGETDIYEQLDALFASQRIRMYGGTWKSNSHDVTTSYLLFQDSNSSNNPLAKIFNAGTSNIYCDEWFSKLTYGSLEVEGNHIIYTNKFSGSPGNSIDFFSYNEIHLLEFSDTPPGGTSMIEHNNFECVYCEIENLIIEDTGDTRLANIFTINGTLEVVNQGSTIKFNGGNGRLDEVIINGVVETPAAGDCQERTIFTNDFNAFTTMTRASGVLTIENAIIEDITTNGNATFNLSSGLLLGASTGWNLTNPATEKNYRWNGPKAVLADWDNPANWLEQNEGMNGCIPSVFDDVFVTSESDGHIRIPAGFTAQCRNFIWENQDGLELVLDGQVNASSKLVISGSLQLDDSALITPNNSHEIIFQSANLNTIQTSNVALPKLRFIGSLGEWHLMDKFSSTQIVFESGTLDTKGETLVTGYWSSIGSSPKNFIFNNSKIVITGEFAISRLPQDNVTVDAGTSSIDCDQLTCTITDLYDVKLSNTVPRTLDNYPYNFNRLILNSTNKITTLNSLTVNSLIFNVPGSTLAIDEIDGLFINEGIESFADSPNPGVLKSKVSGTQAEVSKLVGNLCVDGIVAFQDINADMFGVFNAPDGIDGGNNNGINYESGSSSTELYWIGGSGDWQDVNNWSRVSGGCPSIKSPDDALRVVFDQYSFTNNDEVIDVPFSSITNSIHFRNTNYYANFEIVSSLTADTIYVDGGIAEFNGKNLFVEEYTIVKSGLVISDMTNHNTLGLKQEAGLILVRPSSTFKVLE